MEEVKLIQLDKIGSSSLGYITVGESLKNIPFDIKRVYWTYYTPQDVTRGGHAHKDLQQVIFAVSGTITFNLTDQLGNKKTVVLSNPSEGLYLPKLIWRDIHFTHNAVLLCLASEYYTEDDYFRNYKDFESFKNIDSLTFVDYTEDVLEKSWEWLNDPEIKYLTDTPDFTKEDQLQWYKSLENNKNYFIKGIISDSKLIGVVGLKKIDKKLKTAEYFGYIGEKEYWNKGYSAQIFQYILNKAKKDLELEELYLNVLKENVRAIKSYTKAGFKIINQDNNRVIMLIKL